MEDSLYITRHEKSLGVLTNKFVSLLKKSPNGTVDLKSAAEHLAVSQKRRIYDITNVLEGIGLIEKKNKNIVKWKGNCNNIAYELPGQTDSLKMELASMRRYENILETHIQQCQQNVKNILEDEKNIKRSYLLDSDMDKCFEDHMFLAVKAEPGTRLEVPVVNHSEEKCNPKYMIHLKSASNPIEVFFFQEGSKMKDVRNLNNINNTECDEVEDIKPYSNNSEVRSSSDKTNLTEDMVEASVLLGDLCKDFSLPDMETDALEDGYTNNVSNPFLRLSPPPNSRDYSFNLADSEGISDLFDVPMVLK